MNESDFRYDVYRSGVNQPVAVRVTHLPTGLTATAEDRSQRRATDDAKAEVIRLLEANDGPERTGQ